MERHLDPLKEIYHDSLIEIPEHALDLKQHHTALLVIDVQYLDAAEGHGVFAPGAHETISADARRYYFDRLKSTTLPNIRRLQDAFRAAKLEVIHTRIQALTEDGRDRSRGHMRLKLLAAPGSKEAEFLPEVAPVGDEIVINKTASGVFSSTNLNYVLNNLGITSLFICGVYTNECVETTVRDACDLGYVTTIPEDACATVTPELHEASLATLRDRYARIRSTRAIIEEVVRVCG